jgi:hypothetical protein
MFVGHLAPALALKRCTSPVPLWVLFVCALLNDIIWAALILLGPENGQYTPLDAFLFPMAFPKLAISHSLATSIIWAGLAAGLVALIWRRSGARAAAMVAALAVASHWPLDLIMQRADLPLWPGGPKLGFGLLDAPATAIILEVTVLLGGLAVYARATTARGPIGDFSPVIAGMLFFFSFAAHTLSPPPDSAFHLAVFALPTFASFIALAAWLDHTRAPRSAPPTRVAPVPLAGS